MILPTLGRAHLRDYRAAISLSLGLDGLAGGDMAGNSTADPHRAFLA
jgi:hypothetical protein